MEVVENEREEAYTLSWRSLELPYSGRGRYCEVDRINPEVDPQASEFK